MEISALTRSVVKRNHAVISPDGYINSRVPGWDDCVVNVIINEQMGARLCQALVTLSATGRMEGTTKDSQVFFYIMNGECDATVNEEKKRIRQGQFVHVPPGNKYLFENPEEGARILTFHKVYEQLDGWEKPPVLFGDAVNVP